MTPSRFRWGLILILIGVLWFMHNTDILVNDFWRELGLYLPVVLIAIGIEKIFTKSKLSFISYLTSIALVAGALAIALTYGLNGRDNGGYFSESTFEWGQDPRVQTIQAKLDLGITDLTIRDSGERIVSGRFDRFTRKPDIDYKVEGDRAELTLHNQPHRFFGGIVRIEPGEKPNWYLEFARDVPLELECIGEEADLHLNLATTPLRQLRLEAPDSDVYLKLGDLETKVSVEIIGSDSKLKLRIPQQVGLKVYGKDYQSYLEHLGLSLLDGGYSTAGFDTASNQIEVKVDDQLSSFSIDFF